MRIPVPSRRLPYAGLVAALLAPAVAAASELSGSATLTSDYVWRGSTQTQGDPAVQAGLRVDAASGVYGSVWGSSVEFAPELHASSEFDYVVGWGRELRPGLALETNVTYYDYPSTTVDLDWAELNASLTWQDRYWIGLGWSPEALGSDQSGLYAQVGARYPVSKRLRLEAAAAHYALGGDLDSYTHGQLSAIWAVKSPLELRLTVHATDAAAKRLFGADNAGNRIEAAVQASF